jgi:hypothetical protein
MVSAEIGRRVRTEKLVRASKELFEVGALEAGPLDIFYVRRLNTVMARQRPDMEKNIPTTLADAINDKGTLTKHAELVVFGNWLINGSPGAKPRPGRRVDPKKILKCVAAIMVEIKTPARKKSHKRLARGRVSRSREITKTDVAKQWMRLFDKKITASNLDAPLRSARHVLSDYLQHLKSGSALYGSKTIKKSREIERGLAAINGFLPASQIARPEIFTEPDAPRPATPVPFDVTLEYQSDTHAEEHRRLPTSAKIHPQIRYVPQVTSTTSSSGKARADREGTITLVPDVDIRNDYQVKALIDRLAILITTNDKTDRTRLTKQIEKKTGRATFAEDLTNIENKKVWVTPLPLPDLRKLTGYHFAIMIQEPTPEVLATILRAIEDGPGLVEPVQLHLIEVSVDFYPRKPCTPEEAVLRREQMVGLLQRHHWARPSRMAECDFTKPRNADARQLYEEEVAYGEVVPKTSFLFAHVKSSGGFYKNETDALISDPKIRTRILTKNQGSKLQLNSTLAKGGKYSPHMVSIQNKIADRRNPNRETCVSLPDDERRARMEVTISGTETLKK